jgi:phosphoribosylanthranilate isomerase
MSVKVKICGITSVRDAVAAVDAGADALGFMFYPGSPRCVTSDQVAAITRELPPFVARVGVFVNAPADAVRLMVEQCALDTLQFHGHETPEFCRQFGVKVIKAFRVKGEESLHGMSAYQKEAWLLDGYVDGQLGGTGLRCDWELAAKATRLSRMVVLAGGLNAANAAEAVRQVRPYALDVSSGVEAQPGRKDHHKLRDFLAAAKNAH